MRLSARKFVKSERKIIYFCVEKSDRLKPAETQDDLAGMMKCYSEYLGCEEEI